MDPKYIIWGSSGHSKVLNEVLEMSGGIVVALFDSNPNATPSLIEVPLYYGSDGLNIWIKNNGDIDALGAIAIGGQNGRDRQKIASLFEAHGVRTPYLVHPSASVSPSAIIGSGSHILAHVVVAADASIGKLCIVNNGAQIDHETQLENGVHLAPGSILCGCVTVQENAFIGAGAVVLPRINIGRNSIVGAGAVVTRDVPDGAVVAGNPAIFLKGTINND
jgi:sugar O-acyltransferase (sialic acid O-acetyltransferase NeuD family)